MVCFAFFYAANFSENNKKKNRWKTVLITSFTILLTCTTLNSCIKNHFSPNLESVRICKNLFLFMMVCKNLFLFMIIYENLFFFARIFSYSWSSVKISSFFSESFWTLLICENLFLFMMICENFLAHFFAFYSLYENKQAYKYHHLKQIFYHINMIMIFCWLRMSQFYVSYFEFFSFWVWLLFY